jgi:hypothetical protein
MAPRKETPPVPQNKFNAIVAVVNAQAITTVHGITTKTDGTHDDKDVSGEAVVVSSFSSSFALPSLPSLAWGKIHATPTTTVTTDINDLATSQTSLLIATARIDAAAQDEARARGPPSPASPVATRANPSAANMTTREAHKQEEEAKNRFATSRHR